MKERDVKKINKIIIHCSASTFGDANTVRRWHVNGNGWDDIGYHYLILNGYRKKGIYVKEDDGAIEDGRPVNLVGAHCSGQNQNSIGVCLIGDRLFSAEQILISLPFLIGQIMSRHNIKKEEVYPHYKFSKSKTCPNISVELIRSTL